MKKLVINTNLEKNNFVQKITNYVKVNDLDIVREYFLDIPDVDIADVLSNFDDISIIIYVIRVLPTSRAANVFSYLDIQLQEDIINTLSTKENTLILEQLYIDDIINMLEDMPVDIVRKILSITPIKRRDKINNLLKYDNCAGELISVDYVEFLDTETVGQAINKLKERKEISEKTSYYYVINSKRLLVGYFYLSSLFLHNNLNDPISSFMKHNVTSIDVKMSKASLVRSFKKYDLPELPVVNCDHQLIGLITSDDIIDLVEEEVTEDIEKFSGIVHTEQDNYLKTTVWQLFKKRIIWLVFLMITSMFAQLVMMHFLNIGGDLKKPINEKMTQNIMLIYLLIPMLASIASASGNAGSQSSVTIIRSIALGIIKKSDYLKVIWKEFLVSLLVAGFLASINVPRIILIEGINSKFKFDHKWSSIWLAILIINVSLFLTIILSKLIGSILPMLATLIKIDPALIAAPFLTTLIDFLSTSILLSFCWICWKIFM